METPLANPQLLPQILALVLIAASYGFGMIMLWLVVVHLQHRETDGTFSWTLTRALSEKSEIADPALPAGERVTYAPSASRLIAFMGMGVILILFLGVGAVSIWQGLVRNAFPELDNIGWFLTAGASMFVPYAANQIAGAFTALRQK